MLGRNLQNRRTSPTPMIQFRQMKAKLLGTRTKREDGIVHKRKRATCWKVGRFCQSMGRVATIPTLTGRMASVHLS